MKFALLGISHETNTFSEVPASYEEFENSGRSGLLYGKGILDHYKESNYTIAGYIESSLKNNFNLIPLMHAQTGPIGTITKDAYDKISTEMFNMLKNQAPWDAVLIANHGAAVSEEFPDMDGQFCKSVRKIVGPNVPIGITLDMHANVSKMVVDNTDACLVWRTCPHLDAKIRGSKCGDIIYKTVKKEIVPIQHIETPPLLVNIVKQFTGEEPMKSLVDDCFKENETLGVIDTSIAEGYPYADVEQMGMSWIAITDNNANLAEKTAKSMARKGWNKREDLNAPVMSIEEALNKANQEYVGPKPEGIENPLPSDGSALQIMPESEHSSLGPYVLMDVGDNIGGGSSADSTFIVHSARELNISGILQTLYDPEAVKICVKSGVGTNIELFVGAKTDSMHGKPIKIIGKIRNISDGKFLDHRPTHGGFSNFDNGTSVKIDTDDGNTILLNSNRSGNTTREQMYSNGIKPESYKIIIAKGVSSPRPAYQPIAAKILIVNTPGVTTADLNTFNYIRRRKSLYPFDLNANY